MLSYYVSKCSFPQVPPFDIVEELNKSMELWVLNDKPAPQKIHRMIIQIAKFLYEFSRSAHLSPDFLRLGIDLDSLNLFGSVLEPEMRGVEVGGKKTAQGECSHYLLYLLSHFIDCKGTGGDKIVPKQCALQ